MTEFAEDRSRRVGDLFVEKGLITKEQLDEALRMQKETGERLGEIVVGAFGVPRLELASVLAEQWAANDLSRAGDERAAQPEPPSTSVATSHEAPSLAPRPDEPLLRRPIGEIFVERGFISDEQLQAAVEMQRKTGQRLGEVLVEQGALSRLDLASALADQWANLQQSAPPPVRLDEVPAAAVAAGTEASSPSHEAVAALAARLAELEQAVGSVARKSELEALASELRIALSGIEHRVSEDLALDEEKAMSAIMGKIDAMRLVVDEPLKRLAALEERFPDSDTLAERDERLRAELDALATRLDSVAEAPGAGDEIASIKEALEQVAGREAPTSHAFESLKGRVEQLATMLEESRQPAVDPEVSDKLDAVAGQVEAAQTGLASLASRLDELSALGARIDEVSARVPRADVVEELRRSLTELAEQAGAHDHQADYSGQIARLGARLDQVSARLGDVAGQIESVTAAPVDELGVEIAELALRVDALTSAGPAVDLSDFESRLDELERSRAEVSALQQKVGALEGGLEQRRESVDPALEELRARVDRMVDVESLVSDVRRRVDEVAARVEAERAEDLRPALEQLQGRLGALEQGMPSAPLADIESRLGALENGVSGLTEMRDTVVELSGGVQERRVAVDSRLHGIEERLAASAALGDALRQIEERLEGLAHRDDEGRFSALEQALTEVRGSLDGRAPAALENEVRAIVDNLRSLEGRIGDTGAVRAELDRLQDELAARSGDLEQQLRSWR